MNLLAHDITGVYLLKNDVFEDDRGVFSRLFCSRDLKPVLGARSIAQVNHSLTKKIGAIRGLHYQRRPFAEMKIVRCIRGRVIDVAVDLRKGSPSFMKWIAVELSPASGVALIIPEGCAHGFQVLEENSELLYMHTAYYTPECEGGIRFDDPAIDIRWPLPPADLSVRDLSHPLLDEMFEGLMV